MLPETQRERLADTLGEGTCRHRHRGDGAGAAGKPSKKPGYRTFPGGSAGKQPACNTGDLGSIPGSGRSPGEGKGYPLQYSGLENSMDCIVHGFTKSRP